MRMRNNNPLDLEAADGEVIAAGVQATGTTPVVNYLLNGKAWAGGQFVVSKAVDPMELRVQVVFSGTSGGVYDITLMGDGGSNSRYSVGQPHGEAVNSFYFTIDVV